MEPIFNLGTSLLQRGIKNSPTAGKENNSNGPTPETAESVRNTGLLQLKGLIEKGPLAFLVQTLLKILQILHAVLFRCV